MFVVFLFVGLTAGLVIVVGLLAVGDGVGKTRQMPKQIVFDAHEAIEFCAEALPSDVAATITYDQLRRALRLHLEWIQAYHWAPDQMDTTPIVFEEFDALDYVMERADVVGLNASREHVQQILSVHTSYFQVVGAIHVEDQEITNVDLVSMPLLPVEDLPELIENTPPGDTEAGD